MCEVFAWVEKNPEKTPDGEKNREKKHRTILLTILYRKYYAFDLDMNLLISYIFDSYERFVPKSTRQFVLDERFCCSDLFCPSFFHQIPLEVKGIHAKQ